MPDENYDQQFLTSLGAIIAAKRHLTGKKETEVAKAVSISQAELSRIENGRYDSLKATTLNRLLKYLQISWNELPPPPNNIIDYFMSLTIYYAR